MNLSGKTTDQLLAMSEECDIEMAIIQAALGSMPTVLATAIAVTAEMRQRVSA